MDKCEKFDTTRNQWELLPGLNHGRKKHGSSCFNNDIIYVFGGEGESSNIEIPIEKYVLGDESWEIINI